MSKNNIKTKSTNSAVKAKSEDDKNYETKTAKNNSSWLSDVFHGSMMGLSGVAYGSSVSIISNWHDNSFKTILDRLSYLFKKSSVRNYFKNLLSLAIFIISALAIFIISYVVYAEIYKAGYAIAASFLFIGLNTFSIPMLFFIKSKKPKLAINSQQFATYDKPKINWILFAVVFFLIFGIAFVARYAWTTNDYPIGLINFDQYQTYINPLSNNISSTLYSSSNLDTSYILQILFGAFLCGFATFIPGLSGSYLLNVVGVNTDINIAVQYGFGGYNSGIANISSDWAWPVIVISFIGILAGIVTSIFVVNYLLKNHHDLFNTAVLAISIASFIGIFISFNSNEYIVLSNDKSLLGTSIGLFFIPIIPVFGTMLYFQKTKKINIKFLSFIK